MPNILYYTILYYYYYYYCDAPKSADRFPKSSDGFRKASEGFPTPVTSPLRPPTPPAAQMRQYSWRTYVNNEVCLYIRTLKPSKTRKEERKLKDKHLKDFVFKAPHQSREKSVTSRLPSYQKSEGESYSVLCECSNSEISLFDHVSPHTNDIYTLKLLKARKKEREVEFKSLVSTNYDDIVGDIIVTDSNGDVTRRNVNKPIARKRYATKKQSLVHSKGILKSSLSVYSQTFTRIALMLAVIISILGGVLTERLSERKSTIGTKSSLSRSKPCVVLRFHGYSALSSLRESAAAIIGISEGLCSCIHKAMFFNNIKQLIRCMKVLQNTIIRGVTIFTNRSPSNMLKLCTPYYCPDYATLALTTFGKKRFGGKTFGYIYIPIHGLLGYPSILFRYIYCKS